ncbi:response regulator [Oscillochloris sp. ZM17-4]|uniref:response regulator n=1 Tax=Oscillochloris sp. ZM17-4 TaxID=2866714 RepID=UPI001C72C725|nr:response regulator [Oscillochloris sp. ZM17-4]MBX0329040.1 response regulator [Oscillochloris sp. ZM17-4]
MRVLLVEDEAGVRAFLIRAIEHILPDAQVIAASDGQLALTAFLAAPADLVISDNRMPNMSGLDLLRALRERSAVPFIMISAEPSVERQAYRAGASVYLGKPATLSDLRAAISSALAAPIGYTEPCAK